MVPRECDSAATRRRGNVASIAATSPTWASEVSSRTPVRPRAARSRKSANQPAPFLGRRDVQVEDLSVRVGVDAGRDQGLHDHHPAASRTFIVNASAATNVYGPRPAAGSSGDLFVGVGGHPGTWDRDRPVTPNAWTSLSIRRVLTPSR